MQNRTFVPFGTLLRNTLPGSAQVCLECGIAVGLLSVAFADRCTSQIISGSNQIVSDSRRLSASRMAGQFLVLSVGGVRLLIHP